MLSLVGCSLRRKRFCRFCYMQGCGVKGHRGHKPKQVNGKHILIFFFFVLIIQNCKPLLVKKFIGICRSSLYFIYFLFLFFANFFKSHRSGRPIYPSSWVEQVNWVAGTEHFLYPQNGFHDVT